MERTAHLQKVGEIQGALLQTRRNFVDKYRRGNMGSKALTYEPALDREVYATLKRYEDIPERNAYIHARNELNAYTEFQVETFIGERLNVELSSFRYDIRDGKMYGQGRSDNVVEMIQLGRDCRDAIVKDVDKPRQQAEVEQFTKIQDIMGNPTSEIGTTLISISPPGGPGSAYAHNFYDVFVLSQDQITKERYVAAHRYASELSIDEYRAKTQALRPSYMDEYTDGPLDSYFLSHPVVLDTKSHLFGKPEAIHADFHRTHDFLSTEDFSAVQRSIAGLIMSYVNTLVAAPDDKALLDLTLNAIMNKADHVADNLRRKPHVRGKVQHDTPRNYGPATRLEIETLGKQKVRSVGTGCGDSSGFGQEGKHAVNLSSFSTTDYGTDNLGKRTFNCPECGEMNIRPVNQTIGECQHCGSTKVAC